MLLHIGSQDQRFQRIVLTSDIKTEDQFASEMTALSDSVKRPASSVSNSSAGPEAKRHKPFDSRHKCYHCGRLGHKASECRGRTRLEAEKRNRKPGENQAATSSKVSCYRCNEEGHIVPNCPTLCRENPATKEERQVNFCVVEAPTGKLSHQGESFMFCLDSGAECSLIKESVASKFSGKRTTEIVVMRGIGNTCVESTTQILSAVYIGGLTQEITFHVLADNYRKHDIIIGCEILSQGFDVHMTRNSLDICKSKTVNNIARYKTLIISL